MPDVKESSSRKYEWKDWESDFGYICEKRVAAIRSTPPQMDWEAVQSHYSGKYGQDAGEYLERMFAALRFLEHNTESLSEGRIAIAGKNQSAVGRPLLGALWHICHQEPSENLAAKLTVGLVLENARELERNGI